jgi:hypothetical protein
MTYMQFVQYDRGNECISTPHIKSLSPELNPIRYLLALLAHDFLHVSRIRVNVMPQIYKASVSVRYEVQIAHSNLNEIQ